RKAAQPESPRVRRDPGNSDPTRAGRACRGMRRAGNVPKLPADKRASITRSRLPGAFRLGIGLGMTDSAKARAPILAAGGIVLREGLRPRIAVVQLRRDKAWVLPKGKLYPGEPALAAAKREVMEETGHRVSVREFLGAMSYTVNGKVKIVQFWHM